MPFALFAVPRLLVAAFFLLTSAYAVLNCSPFAFDMFIRPQLFPWLTTFVAWHHVGFAGAYVLSLATLARQLDWRATRRGAGRIAHWLALAYAAVLGATALWLLAAPFLPTLWNDGRALPTALAALVPLLWLAAIDHLDSGWAASRPSTPRAAAGQQRLLVTCSAATIYLWALHLVHAALHGDRTGGLLAWLVTSLWTLCLVAGTFSVAYVLYGLVSAIAARIQSRWRVEYGLVVALCALGMAAFFHRVIFPTVSLGRFDSLAIALVAGSSLAAAWSGLALRRAGPRSEAPQTPADLLFAPAATGRGRAFATVALVVLPVLSLFALNAVERLDWAFVIQRTLVAGEFVAVFGLVLRLADRTSERGYSVAALVVPPCLVLAAIVAVPLATSALASRTGARSLEPTVAFERHAAAEVAFNLVSDLFVSRPGFDADYYRFLQVHADFSGGASITVPDIELTMPVSPAVDSGARRPDIFVFVVDSLRRDYLSPYNEAVTFTPNIDSFSAESFAFQNAFTRHGGTELAMPSIWSGASVVRKVRSHRFERMNAMEKLVNANGYRMAINDFTVAEHLRKTTPVTTIDAGVPSVETDLCQNLESLQGHLDGTAGDRRPVFGYFAPMNVHILNTRRGGQGSLDGGYPGFYPAYASRLKRIDACFGRFVSYLKARGRYDDSVIVLTSDHGDSLGENGYWGHAMWLFPEDVRVPLIVHVPETLRPGLTTDLARVTFSTDIAPTLYALLGHPVRRDLGPLFGEPLFVPAGATLSDRRRAAFLLTSSYGATYGLLRRNGRLLYISDLVEWREFAYDLSSGGIGKPSEMDTDLRRLNQRGIREQVEELSSFYRVAR